MPRNVHGRHATRQGRASQNPVIAVTRTGRHELQQGFPAEEGCSRAGLQKRADVLLDRGPVERGDPLGEERSPRVRLRDGPLPPGLLERVHPVAAILRSSGSRSIAEAADAAGVSRQHLARLFDVHVGLSPKRFARVTRFRRAIVLGRSRRWPDVASTLGYADQSHLIAEFREFAGTTPVPFFLDERG